MKQFFKFMFASMVGFFLSMIVMFFVVIGIIALIVGSLDSDTTVYVAKDTTLKITLTHPVEDRTPENPFEHMDFADMNMNAPQGLNDILKSIRRAAEDDKVKGILLDLSYIPASLSDIEEIRNALIDFKGSGKFLIAYGEVLTQKGYYLATASDEIYINPNGRMEFKGLNAEVMFFKGLLDKLGINTEFVRAGKFKSAVEPFSQKSMSQANKEQLQQMIDSMWENILLKISVSREISTEALDKIADTKALLMPEEAVSLRLTDGMKEFHEIISLIKESYKVEDYKPMGLGRYKYAPRTEREKNFENADDKIAVVYASGIIHSGSGQGYSIGSDTYAQMIRDIIDNPYVKAIVLRVNSPGGSPLASDVILTELERANREMPIIVSMGELAASGGYWISCMADSIIADPYSITGSIGVYGMFFKTKEFFNDNLGITFDNVTTNRYSDLYSSNRSFNSYEKTLIEKEIDRVYERFIGLVAESRSMAVNEVEEIAQGRVWSGLDAARLGLIDGLGGLERAINIAARMAKLKYYDIINYPVQDDFFEVLRNMLVSKADYGIIEEIIGNGAALFKDIETVRKMEGVQALPPFYISIN